MKKVVFVLLAFALFLSPVGDVIMQDEVVAEAKRYKSGKKGFSNNNAPTTNSTQKKKETNQSTTKQNAQNKPAGSKGGLLGGLMLGGLAGLMFGGLLANMGALGPIVGMLINILAILVLVVLIKKVLQAIFKKKDEANTYR